MGRIVNQEDTYVSFRKNIKKYRKDNGLTLKDLAEILEVKEATVQRYESGQIKNVPYSSIVKLASVFRIAPEQLLGWDEIETEITIAEDIANQIEKAYGSEVTDIFMSAICLSDESRKSLKQMAIQLMKLEDKYFKSEG